MSEFKKYRRTAIAEMRPVTPEEEMNGPEVLHAAGISVSQADASAGSPKLGDMIARNPKNHDDQWLVAAQYFKDNFEPTEKLLAPSHPDDIR